MLIYRAWNIGKTVEHSAALTLQIGSMKLLQDTVESGNASLVDRLAAFAPQQSTSGNDTRDPHDRTVVSFYKGTRRGRAYKCCFNLPRCFTAAVREFAMQNDGRVWTVQLRPVNIRPTYTYAFYFVRRGDTTAVREVLSRGELSVHHQAEGLYGSPSSNLLEVSIANH